MSELEKNPWCKDFSGLKAYLPQIGDFVYRDGGIWRDVDGMPVTAGLSDGALIEGELFPGELGLGRLFYHQMGK